jgi:hypothetical protein
MEDLVTRAIEKANNANGDKEVNASCIEITGLLKSYPTDTLLLHARALLYFKLDKLGLAINDYRLIATIDTEDQFASSQIENLGTILRFRNTDIFENPNTTFDPWLE